MENIDTSGAAALNTAGQVQVQAAAADANVADKSNEAGAERASDDNNKADDARDPILPPKVEAAIKALIAAEVQKALPEVEAAVDARLNEFAARLPSFAGDAYADMSKELDALKLKLRHWL